MSEYDIDEMKYERLSIFIVSTYEGGLPPTSSIPFYQQLKEDAQDFKLDKNHLKKLSYAIFGLGHSEYNRNFNKAGKNVNRFLKKLSAKPIVKPYFSDVASGKDIFDQYNEFCASLWDPIHKVLERSRQTYDHESDSESENDEPLLDVEELGTSMKSYKDEEEDDDELENFDPTLPPKEMITPTLRKALTKQGYKLIGSHSGVKLCRWTKSMMRGRGGCYKHTFYGISSFQCMEMTPSLACANKCVFCWRHHKNPVGTSWRWQLDSPEMLVEQAIQNHQKMVKQLRGVPGVDPDRFKEAANIQHCALSLVGEPIIYPHINEFLGLLHQKKISSFLVTNAQFPEEMAKLPSITQMYISVDAATKDSLKAVDRPLFADFWERFLKCIEELSLKGQRTVFRMTLIKQWNMDEIYNYADLVTKGMPGFVEVKGVTYCGSSDASSLRMTNVPFHHEVVSFTQKLCDKVNEILGEVRYELASEHEHSCCILIADKKFKVDGEWHTWIDYEKFHSLTASGKSFVDTDYMAKTPSWAYFGSAEKGFDPNETRFKRSTKPPTQGC